MGQYFLIEDFKSGLDRRRMNVTAPSGTLVTAENVNITRGGEIEKAEKVGKFLTLPANTFGLTATPKGFYVFGSADISGTYTNNVLNSNPPVRYQRLNITSAAAMVRVLSITLYDARPYVIAEYADGTVHHFWDGTEIPATEWFSGRARFKFSVTDGSAGAATSASGSFRLTGGFIGDTVTHVNVDGNNLLAATVTFISGQTLEDFIESVKTAINSNSVASGYTATRSGNRITLTSILPGTGPNGDVVAITEVGTLAASDIENISGGTDASKLTVLTVDGNSIIDTTISWAGSNSQTADAIATAIKAYSATSGFTAQAFGQEVVIIRDADEVNTDAVVITAAAPFTVSPASGSMAGGSATPSVLEPARFAKTIDTKVYALSESLMRFSAVDDPTDWTVGAGFGFENLSTNASGSENLVAIANYFDDIAVFSRNNVQVWFVDPDPTNNALLQVLNNTGAIAAGSVVEYGDNDVFYLSESGIRSLRARDSSNAAFVNDVGIQIDDLVQAKILADGIAASEAQAILEPREGRYMLAIDETVYVFSYFPSSKVSAWTTYALPFDAEWWAYSGQLVVVRSATALYQLGSVSGKVYDNTTATVIIPFLDAGTPANQKQWTGLDIAAEGTWRVYAAFDPKQPDEFIEVGTLQGTTFNDMNAGAGMGISTHISLKFTSTDADGAKLGSVGIHYMLGDAA